MTRPEIPNGIGFVSSNKTEALLPSLSFAEKLVPVLVDLFLQAPLVEKYIMFPEVVQGLRRYKMVQYLILKTVGDS